MELLLGASYGWVLHVYNFILFLTFSQMMKETQIFTRLRQFRCASVRILNPGVSGS